MKACRVCGTEKSIDEFYRHSQTADGRLSICKGCAKRRSAEHRQRNLDRIQAYDRQRGQLPHRKAKVAARSHLYAAGRAKFIERHPEKRRAHVITNNAVRDGRLVPQPCERCGAKAEAHHEDYSKPLEVTWLCKTHHSERHRELNEMTRARVRTDRASPPAGGDDYGPSSFT